MQGEMACLFILLMNFDQISKDFVFLIEPIDGWIGLGDDQDMINLKFYSLDQDIYD